MFGDFHAHRRDVKDMSPFITAHRRFFQGSMALLTTAHPMNLDMVWMRHEFQGMSRMSRLGANVLPTGLAQRASLRLLQAIAGRRFAAVATVFGQLVFQCLNPGL
jgi:hypothetical protein